ncbi:MAG TPA: winged helix-turn-helix domain-containing protein [Myxococcota bacterium]|nr:winged helix-turn-helix domain-containing protein [Myxococcota bacterium]
MEQLTMNLRARRTDPRPSHAAAAQAARFARSHAGRILAAVREYPGLTTHRLAEVTGLSVCQIDRRGIEMQRAGLIVRRDVGGRALAWFAL